MVGGIPAERTGAVLLRPVWDIALVAGCLGACVPEVQALVRGGPERWAGTGRGPEPLSWQVPLPPLPRCPQPQTLVTRTR